MKVMDAASDAVHGKIQGVLQIFKKSCKPGFLVHGPGCPKHENGPGKHMAYIVVDFSCDTVSLF